MICLIFIAAELQNNQIKTVILIILYLHVFLVIFILSLKLNQEHMIKERSNGSHVMYNVYSL